MTPKQIPKQTNRGVIPSLLGRNTETRNRLREKWAKARIEERVWRQLYSEPPGLHYERIERQYPGFGQFVMRKMQGLVLDWVNGKANSTKKLRWLDIGPGLPEHFMPFFHSIDPAGEFIDLHTLAPTQINPKKVKGNPTGKILDLTGGKIPVHKIKANPGYNPRMNHHVGLIETYDPEKLKGRFDVIVSMLGGSYFAVNANETVVKIGRLLERDGTAFLDAEIATVKTKCKPPEFIPRSRETEIRNRRWLQQIQKKLGQRFVVHELPMPYETNTVRFTIQRRA